MKKEKYIISRERLLDLLAKEMELGELECSGVDNWSYYGEGREEYIRICAAGRFSEEELEDIGYGDIAALDIEQYERVEE